MVLDFDELGTISVPLEDKNVLWHTYRMLDRTTHKGKKYSEQERINIKMWEESKERKIKG